MILSVLALSLFAVTLVGCHAGVDVDPHRSSTSLTPAR
jgi:hypothetical protein